MEMKEEVDRVNKALSDTQKGFAKMQEKHDRYQDAMIRTALIHVAGGILETHKTSNTDKLYDLAMEFLCGEYTNALKTDKE
jgi:hypothetical protein